MARDVASISPDSELGRRVGRIRIDDIHRLSELFLALMEKNGADCVELDAKHNASLVQVTDLLYGLADGNMAEQVALLAMLIPSLTCTLYGALEEIKLDMDILSFEEGTDEASME